MYYSVSRAGSIGVASAAGDPVYHTFDGQEIIFQGRCHYKLTGTCPDSDLPDGVPEFAINVANKKSIADGDRSYTATVHMDMEYHRLKVDDLAAIKVITHPHTHAHTRTHMDMEYHRLKVDDLAAIKVITHPHTHAHSRTHMDMEYHRLKVDDLAAIKVITHPHTHAHTRTHMDMEYHRLKVDDLAAIKVITHPHTHAHTHAHTHEHGVPPPQGGRPRRH